MAPQPKLAILLCENSGAVVEWLMDKFNLDVSLVARVGGYSAPRTYRDPHLCFDSDGEEDGRKVRQGENDHQSMGDGVDHEWWCVFDECVDFGKKKRRRRRRRVRVFAHWCHVVVRRRDHRHSDGAVPVPRVRLQAGDVQRQLDGGAGVRDTGARPDRFCAVARRAFLTSVNTRHVSWSSLPG